MDSGDRMGSVRRDSNGWQLVDGARMRGEVIAVLRHGGVYGPVKQVIRSRNMVVNGGKALDRQQLAWKSSPQTLGEVNGFTYPAMSKAGHFDRMGEILAVPVGQLVVGTGSTAPALSDTSLSGSQLGYDFTADSWYTIPNYADATNYWGNTNLRLRGHGLDKVKPTDSGNTRKLRFFKHFPSNAELAQSASDDINANTISEAGLYPPKTITTGFYKLNGKVGGGGTGTWSGAATDARVRWERHQFAAAVNPQDTLGGASAIPWRIAAVLNAASASIDGTTDEDPAGFVVEDDAGAAAPYYRLEQDKITLYDDVSGLSTNARYFLIAWMAQNVFGDTLPRIFARTTFTGFTKNFNDGLTMYWELTVKDDSEA